MEEGRKYRVFYDDGERVRDKTLIFKSFTNNFAVFYNPVTKLEETLNLSFIIRIEGIDDGGR
jgi:hypothetical protein